MINASSTCVGLTRSCRDKVTRCRIICPASGYHPALAADSAVATCLVLSSYQHVANLHHSPILWFSNRMNLSPIIILLYKLLRICPAPILLLLPQTTESHILGRPWNRIRDVRSLNILCRCVHSWSCSEP